MSYITLMVNDAGAVAAADSRESFYNIAHFNWLRKVYTLPERNMVLALCGPSFRHGVPLFRTAVSILRRDGGVEQALERIGRMVAAATALRLPREDPGPFVLLAAAWEGNGFTVYNFCVQQGKRTLQKTRVEQGQTLALHAGAWHRQMPRLSTRALSGLDLEELRTLARARVALAIEKDALRKRDNPRHNQTIGGAVYTCSVRVQRCRSISVDEKSATNSDNSLEPGQ